MPEPSAASRFVRLAEDQRPHLTLRIDGEPATALEGDTLLVALMLHGRRVRDSEFGDGPRAGFCLMGACQDCWVWREDGQRLRACSTPVTAGMAVLTRPPASHWPTTPDLRDSLEAKR
ncbi:(2Fe-2S)-binding protein [Aquabacterium sp.]|uniref:(2Fe-2S)-binding protein n=1 Tax=Aquabacterium sp. TaxID=1872578 RepID=UPI002B78B840|nr:(2Fe-2S)-binding protein [Aquabacterium sp.]HSW04662.1 (2Fe-2S)-binding protein [Aquabacterium sp.]